MENNNPLENTGEKSSSETTIEKDGVLWTTDIKEANNTAFFGTLISETGDNCDQAMRRANDRAKAFMREHNKPCYKAATRCDYDERTKLYTATANVHNEPGSC